MPMVLADALSCWRMRGRSHGRIVAKEARSATPEMVRGSRGRLLLYGLKIADKQGVHVAKGVLG